MPTHRSDRWVVYGDGAEIDKLFNDRYRVTFRCQPISKTEDWYYENEDRIFADFGDLWSAAHTVDGVDPKAGEAYPNMVLVEQGLKYTPTGEWVIEFVYETLTTAFTREKQDEIFKTESGLLGIRRTTVAKETSDIGGGSIGIESINYNFTGGAAIVLYLASYELTRTAAKTTLEQVWLERGVLREEYDFVGSTLAIVQDVFGDTPSTPSGYSVARTEESNYEGYKTNRYTFLKDGVKLSESKRNLSEGVIEVTQSYFKTLGTIVGPITRKTTDDFEGIPTITVVSLQDKDGNALTNTGENLVHSYERLIPFEYPGVVSIATDTDASLTDPADATFTISSYYYDLTPPVNSKVESTVYVFFQDSSEIAAADYTYDTAVGLWNPTGWAKGEINGIATNWSISSASPISRTKGFVGYRTGTPSSATGTGGTGSGVKAVEGNYILPGAAYSISVSGGPSDPTGDKYVLDVDIRPAFEDIDGNIYFKKTIVVATL